MILLPFNELRFNIAFRVLITLYGISWLGKFMVSIPDNCDKEDKYFKCSKWDFSFSLISSLIFFCLWLFHFEYVWLFYLTVLDIIVILVLYLNTFINKQIYVKQQADKLKRTKKRNAESFK
jgi:heme exporter protein D